MRTLTRHSDMTEKLLQKTCEKLQDIGVNAFTDHGKIFVDICEEPELTIEMSEQDVLTVIALIESKN
jgi:hypothetical protein